VAERKAKSDAPLLEWIVGGAGAVIFIGILSILVSNAMGGAGAPPPFARVLSGSSLWRRATPSGSLR